MHTTHHLLPEGIALTLWRPAAAGESKLPLIILCHGFCGVRGLLLPAYAEAFVRAGFAAVTFDYRGFGDSEGERGRLLPALQAEDILTVTEWTRMQPGIHRKRIGLWGTSLGGGHVFVAASRDPGIKCVVSQLGFADGAAVVSGHMDEAEKKTLAATLDGMHERKNHTGRETFVSIPRVMSDPESRDFFERHRGRFPEMDVKIPFLTVREIMHYRPAIYAEQVKCPTLVVVADRDTVNPPEQGAALFDAVSVPVKMLYQVTGSATTIFMKERVLNAFPAPRPTGSGPTYDAVPAREDGLMKKLLLAVLILGLLLSLLVPAPCARAGAVPVLAFHMGLGAEGKFFVGGTLRNDGDMLVTAGYIVILPVTERCEPEHFVFYEFGELAAGSTREFRIPVSGRLVSYRLAGAGAVDDMGFALPVRDDTKAVLDARRDEETQVCLTRRSRAHAHP